MVAAPTGLAVVHVPDTAAWSIRAVVANTTEGFDLVSTQQGPSKYGCEFENMVGEALRL